MNNDLISRSELKKAIMNDLGLGDEENGSDAEYMAGLQDCYNLIDNAPTIEQEIYITGEALNPYIDGYREGIKDYQRLLDKVEKLEKEKRPQGIERNVAEYEGLYTVDIFGNVKNLLTGKTIKHYISEYGYHNVYLYKDGKKKGKRVNRLVAIAFIPNPLNKSQVNHIDGDKNNNNVWNLEWVTNKENSIHAGKTGLYGNGAVKIVETGEIFPNVSSLGRYLNVEPSNIYKCLNGKRNKVRGYHFERVADMRGKEE